ncbi:unnamed protein product [Rangifer tarandus platyrhynchus]|uniref:Uncharacterized protein n=1 Tax=Rangifer tarandus platyrhynchus TaxID=3082113 RepID=A0AC59Y0B1_RANTA
MLQEAESEQSRRAPSPGKSPAEPYKGTSLCPAHTSLVLLLGDVSSDLVKDPTDPTLEESGSPSQSLNPRPGPPLTITLVRRPAPPPPGERLISQRSPRPPAGKGSGAVRTQGWALLSAALTEALGGSSC